ncbi:MAG TPA: lysophospholipid acyltransferase family protein [Candidatus Acidoferrum sp.]|nr:lysophospholipid acyltransferase family protein [Candidatus Acidoferrum sp.]
MLNLSAKSPYTITDVSDVAQAEIKSETSAGARSFSFSERVKIWLISWAGFLFIRIIGATLRYRAFAEPGCIADSDGAGPPAIWCFWHRAVIPATYRFRSKGLAVMTSRSFDGEYIARIIQKLGFTAVRGSSSRGAVGALIGMRQQLEQGHGVVFTIDGPRGPRYVAKPGPILLAKKTGVSINCFYIAVERAWILNSWDRMIIPKPFSRALIYGSGPMYVPADATDEQMIALHQQMQETLERCRLGAEAAFSGKPDPFTAKNAKGR